MQNGSAPDAPSLDTPMPDPRGTQAPALRRLELAAALRRHRKTAQLTTAEVTSRLGFSASKLSRLETGNRPIRSEDLSALCDLYGIDSDEQARLAQLVDESRQTSVWQQLDTFDTEASDYMELEQAAYRIDDYKTSTITTLLQVPAYTRAFFRAIFPHMADDLLEEKASTREARRSAMFGRPLLPQLNFILDEAALQRRVGGAVVMREQIQHLLEMTDRPEVSIQILPFTIGAHPGMDSLFTILSFREAVRDRAYVDGFATPHYVTEAKELERYRAAFDRLARLALDRQGSRQLLHSLADG